MTSQAIVPLDPDGLQDWKKLISRTLAKAAKMEDWELDMFAQVCKHLSLDPWRKEIYAIRYGQNSPISFVIGIDGYLRKAAETGLFDGADPTLYAGTDGVWTELWASDEPPYAARATVYRKGSEHGITYIARYASAQRKSRDSNKPNQWDTAPDIMLGINALKQALRRGFGDAFGELDKQVMVLRAEGMPVVDEETGEILDGQEHEIEEPKTHAQQMAEAGLNEIENVKEQVAQKRSERVQNATTRNDRWWEAVHKAAPKGIKWQEWATDWLKEETGATDFRALDDDEQERIIEKMEQEANHE